MHAQHALVVIALLAPVASARQPSASTPKPNSALAMHVPVPPAVVVVDGLHRLLYELHVENHADIGAMGNARWQADGAGRRRDERPGPNTVVNFNPVQ